MGNSNSCRSSCSRLFHDGFAVVAEELERLESCTAVVQDIRVYKSLIKKATVHHYIILTVSRLLSDGIPLSTMGLLIRAEKYAKVTPEGHTIGVKLEVLLEPEDRLIYRAGDLSVTIPMRRLQEILISHNPVYNLLSANCWKYANDTCKDLLKEFACLQSQNREAVAAIRKHLWEIPANIMPVTWIRWGIYGVIFVSKVAVGATCVPLSTLLLAIPWYPLSGSAAVYELFELYQHVRSRTLRNEPIRRSINPTVLLHYETMLRAIENYRATNNSAEPSHELRRIENPVRERQVPILNSEGSLGNGVNLVLRRVNRVQFQY